MHWNYMSTTGRFSLPSAKPVSSGLATGGNLSNLGNFNRVLSLFQIIDPEMPIQMVKTYVQVALAHPEPALMSEMADVLGLAQSSVSRNVAALSDWNRHRVTGHDLVSARENPMDRRQKLVTLTAKGIKLREQML